MSHGAESALSNPALITDVKGTQISFGGTLFMPKVDNYNALNFAPGPDFTSSASSASDMSVIPEVSIASKITDNFYIGVGMWGTAGMGVDYRDAINVGQMSMVTNLQLMQFGVPIAYKINGFSVAVTPILQYGSLDIDYNASFSPVGKQSMGVAQDLKFGYNLGVSYEISGLTVGAVYKSQIDMEYKGFASMVNPFTGLANGYTNNKLSTPAELGFGLSYEISEHTIAFDYKQIKWSDAKGYEDFAWKDQNVYAIGYEYAPKGWAVRVGYNYSKSPIEEQAVVFNSAGRETNINSANLSAGTVNTFNLLGFPGIVESHYTIGGSYDISDMTSVDLAYVYVPETSETYKNFAGQNITTTHSQTSFSAQLNFKF